MYRRCTNEEDRVKQSAYLQVLGPSLLRSS
jgi:hypothetical protein